MSTTRYVHWQEGGMWLGYLEQFPDYPTQEESPGELEENPRDLYWDVTSGDISGLRKVSGLSRMNRSIPTPLGVVSSAA